MTGTATKRQQHSEQMRRKIVAAAAKMLRDRNYNDVSMRDIASALGVTTGTLYHHFSGKDEILLSICRSHEADLNAAMNRYTFEQPLADMVDFLAGPMVQRVLDDGPEFTRHRLFSVMSGKVPTAAPVAASSPESGINRRVKIFLMHAERKGELTPDIPLEDMVDMVVSVYRGAVYYFCTIEPCADLRQMLLRRLRITLRALCTNAETLAALPEK